MAVASGVKYLMYAGSRIMSTHILEESPESTPTITGTLLENITRLPKLRRNRWHLLRKPLVLHKPYHFKTHHFNLSESPTGCVH